MKLKIKDKNNAELTVFYGGKEYVDLMVSINHLEDWYPFSNAYQYKLSKDKSYLELKRLRSILPVSYDVHDNSKRTVENEHRICPLDTMVNPVVQRDNKRMINKAKSYNLPVITEPYTKKQVEKGLTDLGLIFSSLRDIITRKYLEDKTSEEILKFKLKPEETQLAMVLRSCDASVDFTYSELGQIYNMLVLMKKISRYN